MMGCCYFDGVVGFGVSVPEDVELDFTGRGQRVPPLSHFKTVLQILLLSVAVDP